MKFIPVGEATAIFFSAPIFTVIFAKIFLNEPYGKYETFALILSLGGVITVINPVKIIKAAQEDTSLTDHIIGCSLALSSAVIMAGSTVVIRKQRHIHFSVLAFWFGVAMCLLSVVLMISFQSFIPIAFPDTPEEIGICVGAGVSGAIANIFFAIALRFGDAGKVIIAKSTEVIFAAVYQVLLFDQPITITMAVGTVFICVSIGLLNSKKLVLKQLNKLSNKEKT